MKTPIVPQVSMWLPTIPYSIHDAINRIAIATGDVTTAAQNARSNINGHHVNVIFNMFRHYWTAEYFWAERVVLARGTAADCLTAAKREYNRGALGSVVVAHGLNENETHWAVDLGYQPWSKEIQEAHNATWRDPRHAEINHARNLERQVGIPALSFLTSSTTVAEYQAKVDKFVAERKAASRAET